MCPPTGLTGYRRQPVTETCQPQLTTWHVSDTAPNLLDRAHHFYSYPPHQPRQRLWFYSLSMHEMRLRTDFHPVLPLSCPDYMEGFEFDHREYLKKFIGTILFVRHFWHIQAWTYLENFKIYHFKLKFWHTHTWTYLLKYIFLKIKIYVFLNFRCWFLINIWHFLFKVLSYQKSSDCCLCKDFNASHFRISKWVITLLYFRRDEWATKGQVTG